MNDSKNVWNKRVPSLIGILFLTLSVGTIGWLSSNAVLFGTKAAADPTPKNVKISNVSNTAFSVSFITDEPIESTVTYGKNTQPNLVVLDDRDQKKASLAKHSVHHITVTKLDADTKYFFVITSGDKNFSNNNLPYEVTTKKTNATNESILSGKVTRDDGTIPAEAIVYASINSANTATGLLDENGNYNFSLSVLGELQPDTVLNLLIRSPTEESKVSLSADQINPVPLVILSKNYDFLFSTEPLEESETASDSAGTFPQSEESDVNTKPQIINPQEDQQLKDQQPLFSGTALPNADVEITIKSDPITTTVQAGSNGRWQYRPETKLAPGNHTITIKTIDTAGVIKTITQSFVVFAEGSQFTEPSVSPVISQTTPTVTAIPTVKPTSLPALTNTPTPTTVVQLTTTTVPSPTTGQAAIPVTGNTSLLTIIFATVFALGIGALLFVLTAL